MSDTESKPLSDHPLWLAVQSGDIDVASKLLADDPSLANRDYRAVEDQDPHTFGFPLVKAADTGNLEMVRLLLDHGADVDAKSPHEEQRELGGPIMHAFEHQFYDVVHLLLDYGASLDAHGWCYPALVELLYDAARKEDAPHELARKGLARYLGAVEGPDIAADAPEVVRLFDRVMNMGGVPSMESLVCHEYYEAIEALLRTCPESPGTQHDHPPGTVLETLCQAASWCGFPKTLDLAMTCCPTLYTPELAINAINRAIVSHNRDGLARDYDALVETQLRYLRDQGELDSIIAHNRLRPHFALAKSYLWPGWYGNDQDPSSVEAMIRLSQLFTEYGFVDFNRVDPESGNTPLAQARSRADHPGLSQFADYLVEQGAK